MTTMNYIGLDVHKKTISYCVKDASGRNTGGRQDRGDPARAGLSDEDSASAVDRCDGGDDLQRLNLLSNHADVDTSIDPAFFPRLRATSIKRNPRHSRDSPSVKRTPRSPRSHPRRPALLQKIDGKIRVRESAIEMVEFKRMRLPTAAWPQS
jgi:hypothetical protein